jgi:hypothetical protein
MSKYNFNLVEDLKTSFREVNGSEVSEDLVVDFLNEYVYEELVSDGDVVKSDSVLEDFFDYIGTLK